MTAASTGTRPPDDHRGRRAASPRVRAFVRALAASVDADEETTSDLVQAVDELACNVIEHGYRHAPGEIELEGSADGRRRSSSGSATPPRRSIPRSVPEPRLDLPLAHRPFGGMGVHLARTLTDAHRPPYPAGRWQRGDRDQAAAARGGRGREGGPGGRRWTSRPSDRALTSPSSP